MANLEAQLGVVLWDRSTKVPSLTPQGKALLGNARRICADVDALERLAEGFVSGLEASVSLAVDAILPVRAVVDLCRECALKFPSIELHLHTETLSAVSALVLDGTCQIGVIGPAAHAPGLERQRFVSVRLVPVVAREHPLAASPAGVSTQALADHVHIVLSERGHERPTPDQGLLSPRTWRVADLGTKHALLLAGLGWGNVPEHLVQEDLARGRLVRIRPAAWSEDAWDLPLTVVHRPELPMGPVTRWILQRLPELCVREAGVRAGPRVRPGRRR